MSWQKLAFIIGGVVFCTACALFSPAPPTPVTPMPATVTHTVAPSATFTLDPDTTTPSPSTNTPTATFTPPPATLTPGGMGLPDLTTYATVSMDGYTGGCVAAYTPLVTQICIENRGAGAAGAFILRAGDGTHGEWAFEGLAAGEMQCFLSENNLGSMRIMVDPTDVVAESDEGNNIWTIPMPTPPAICTPTPAPDTPTLTPRPLSTDTPTPTPASQSLAIVSFTADVEDLAEGGKRITFHWTTTGATEVQLVSGTQHRFPLWWPGLEPQGSFTYDFSGTNYPDPQMSLTAVAPDGEKITENLTIAWACKYTYFFAPVPPACPLHPATMTDAAEQRFEQGRMIWLRGIDSGDYKAGAVIFVFYSDGNFEQFEDTWSEEQPDHDPDIVPPPDLEQPARGFGKIWRENAQVRDGLGWALSPEQAYTGAWQPEIRESIPSVAYVRAIDQQILRTYGWDYGSWDFWTGE